MDRWNQDRGWAQSKTIVHKNSFQLFPGKSEEYHKFILRNLFKALVILILGIYTLVVINRYIGEREYLHYKQAWQYLYNRQNEGQKQFLEKVMEVSEKGDVSIEARPDTKSRKDGLRSIAKPSKKWI